MKSTIYLRTLQIIHVAIMLGIVVFWVIIVLAIQPPMQPDMPDIVIYALTVMGFVACLAGSVLGFNLQNKAKSETQLSNKLQQYRTAHIIFLGTMEGAAMLFLIAYLFSAYWWTQFFGAILAIMAIYFPTRTRIINALELSNSDINEWDSLG